MVASSPASDELRPDASGFLKLTAQGLLEEFGQDLPDPENKGNDRSSSD